jgi:GAF domain-containing protein
VPNPAGSIDRYERLLEVQTLMARVSREMGPALDLDRVLRTVLEALRELVPCDGGCISLTEGDAIVLAATHPHYDLPADGQDSSFARHVTATAKSIHARDLAVDETPEPLAAKRAYAYGIRSFLCVPLICMGQPIGALSVFASEPDLFDEEHLLLVEGLATQVAGTVENARRYRMITELEVLRATSSPGCPTSSAHRSRSCRASSARCSRTTTTSTTRHGGACSNASTWPPRACRASSTSC